MKNLLLTTCCIFTILNLSGREPVKPSALLSPEEKVYGLAKFWQEANYNFVFMDRVDKQAWDSTFKAMIPLAMDSENDYQYYRLLVRLCAVLDDGHTYIQPPNFKNFLKNNAGRNVIIPFIHNDFEEGIVAFTDVAGMPVVTAVDKYLAEKIPLGSRVLSVDGIPVEDYITEYTLPYVGENAEHIRRIRSVGMLGAGLDGDKRSFFYTTPLGESREILLTFTSEDRQFGDDDFERLHSGNHPWQWTRYREADKGIGYLQLNSFNNYEIVEEFESHIPEIKKLNALIIDLRNNGGGNTGHGTAILQYFSPDSILYGSKSETRINVSAWKAWGQYRNEADTVGTERLKNQYLAYRDRLMESLGTMDHINTVPPDERMIIPIVVLTGYNTASAAEDFLIFADTQENITRIGTRTYGSTGQPLGVFLPGGMYGGICSKNDSYPDGRAFVGPGVIPHIEIIPTLEELLSGEDLALQAAIDYLKGKI